MPPHVEKLQNIITALKPKWPKIHKYIGGGVNGRVFELNDGRYMKIIANNASHEWKTLLRLQGTHVVPRFNKNNHLLLEVKPEGKNFVRALLNMKKVGNKLTFMIMGRVGGIKAMTLKNYIKKYPNNGGQAMTLKNYIKKYPHKNTRHVGGEQAMTLKNYIKKYPHKNTRHVQTRILHIIDEMHIRGVSHGNLHSGNILVTADSAGRITGMWVIDFGRATEIPLGMTERQHYYRKEPNSTHPTQTLSGQNYVNVPVFNGSRANVHMSKTHYGKNYIRPRENILRNRRLNIAENLKLMKSPRKSPRRSKSASPPRKNRVVSSRPRSASATKN
jgi:hypothetical protein